MRKVESGLWRVRIAPKSWKDMTVTLAGGRACGAAGAVCTADGRALTNTSSAAVGGPVRIRVADARAREGKDASLDFAVTLSRAAAQEVSVDYATEDGTAKAGADYTAVSGTLTFAPGETAKTVSVPLLDDAIDEGKETFKLRLSNPRGAYGTGGSRAGIGDGRARGGEVAPLDGRAYLGRGQGGLGVELRKLDARAGPALDPEGQGAGARRLARPRAPPGAGAVAGDAGLGIGRVATVCPAGVGKSRCGVCRPGLPSLERGGGVSETGICSGPGG